ncbi:MAG: tRNA-U20-dihydrouridine synthase [Francisellaceae bacterium]|nr:tRNA-U20-dihydrouridine synthase [Francisellaceae bacterium]
MQIGQLKISNNLVLAPMAGVTDRPFRILCKKLGAGMAVSEMVGSNSLLRGSLKTLRRANHEGETLPKSVQIVGADPLMMAEAARYNEAEGAQIIDINMGCPAKKVCNTLSGSALLRDEPLVARILEAVVNAVNIPVTLKIRTGWDCENRNGVAIALLAERCGIQALSVHGRTRSCFFKGEAEYETIARIKAAVKIPIIANGDITSPEKAKAVLLKTQADGIMIGRAAQGRPWIFKEIDHYLKTGEKLPELSITEIRNILLEHIENVYSFYGEARGALIARKHVSWYTKGQPGGARFRDQFNRLDNTTAQLTSAKAFFDQLINEQIL